MESADETAEGVFAFPETAHETGQNKMSEYTGSAFASNVEVNMNVPASILSHRSHKIKVNKGGVTRNNLCIQAACSQRLASNKPSCI